MQEGREDLPGSNVVGGEDDDWPVYLLSVSAFRLLLGSCFLYFLLRLCVCCFFFLFAWFLLLFCFGSSVWSGGGATQRQG